MFTKTCKHPAAIRVTQLMRPLIDVFAGASWRDKTKVKTKTKEKKK
jgi:hypothetical protein